MDGFIFFLFCRHTYLTVERSCFPTLHRPVSFVFYGLEDFWEWTGGFAILTGENNYFVSGPKMDMFTGSLNLAEVDGDDEMSRKRLMMAN